MSSIAQLEHDRDKLAKQLNVLSGHHQSNLTEKTRLVSSISEASHYLSKKDALSKALTLIYNKSQQEGVKLYEELLTKLVHEIMPTNDQCERVILEQGMKRNRPTLNIKIQTSDGMIRDVSDDKGGSIQNILAIGLRFIYVATTPGRNFIVFDEADTGLSEVHMDDFARMMDYLSRMTGIQVLYISHHPDKYFVGKGRIHHLRRANGKITSSISHDYSDENSEKDDIQNEYVTDFSELYIRNIRLVNCGQHEDTTLELSPFVNYIVGGNDIGKSTVIKLIKAVAFNKCNTSYIRDNAPELSVSFGLEEDVSFEYTYKKKGSKRTSYLVKDRDGNVLNSSDSGDKAPSFINEYFSFHKFKNICPSISEQVSPIFIFDNDKFSEHERAEILKLSDNASQAQKMIHRHNELINKYTSQKRESEQRLNVIKGKLNSLGIMNYIEDFIEKLDVMIAEEKKRVFIVENIEPIAKSIVKCENDIQLIESVLSFDDSSFNEVSYKSEESGSIANTIESSEFAIASISSALSDTEKLITCDYMPTEEINLLNKQIDSLSNEISAISEVTSLPSISMPEVKSTEDVKNIAISIKELSGQVTILSDISLMKDIAPPATSPVREIRSIGGHISTLEKEIHSIRNEINQADMHENELNKTFESSLKHFATCPLCKQQLSH